MGLIGEQVLDRFFQPLEIDRLGQVLGKAGVAGAVYVVFHTETGESDAAQSFVLQLVHQFITAAVGQADVADE